MACPVQNGKLVPGGAFEGLWLRDARAFARRMLQRLGGFEHPKLMVQCKE